MKKRDERIKTAYSVVRACGHKYFYEQISFKAALELAGTCCFSCETPAGEAKVTHSA